MKKILKEIKEWLIVLWYTGVIPLVLVLFIAYQIAVSDLPDWFKFWLLK